MVDDKRVRELVKEMKLLVRKSDYCEPEYEIFWNDLLEAFGDDIEDIIRYYNDMDIDDLSFISGGFEDVYKKFMTEYAWDELGKLEEKVSEYERGGELRKKEKKVLVDTKKLIKKLDKACKSEKDFKKPIYQELLKKIGDKFNDDYLGYTAIIFMFNEFSVDVLKKLKPLLEKMSAEGWECVRYSLERIEEDAK